MGNGMCVVKLSVQNFERLVAIEVEPDPDDPLVQVTSKRNGEGKSSLLNAIATALGGSDWLPKQPVHGSAEKGEVSVDVGPYTIRRSFTKLGGGTLTIRRNEDESLLARPAETLAEWRSDLTLDPLEFVTMNDKQRRVALLAVLGLEEKLKDLDEKRERAFSSRTEVNREVKRLKGGLAEYGDLPEKAPEIPSTTDVIAKRKDLESEAGAYADQEQKLNDEMYVLDKKNEFHNALEAQIADLYRQIAEKQEEQKQLAQTITSQQTAVEAAQSKLDGMNRPSADQFDELDATLERASEAAVLKTRWEAAARVRADLAEAELKSERLTGELDAIDREKDKLLKESDLPLPELGIDENGVTFGGYPFLQASDAEKLRAGFAVAMARNPKTRVALIRNGSQLDDDNLALFRELGREFDCQVWIESLDRTGTTGVVIEDGRLAGKAGASDA